MFQTFLFWGVSVDIRVMVFIKTWKKKPRDGPFMAILYPLLEPACCLYNPYRRKEETRN